MQKQRSLLAISVSTKRWEVGGLRRYPLVGLGPVVEFCAKQMRNFVEAGRMIVGRFDVVLRRCIAGFGHSIINHNLSP